MKSFFSATLMLVCMLSGCSSMKAQETLEQKIDAYLKEKKAEVGVAVKEIGSDTYSQHNGNMAFPMQSVFKFHIVWTALHFVDQGKLQMDQIIQPTEKDLSFDTWSPIRDAMLGKPNPKIALKDMMAYTVSQSDNLGCDIILRLLGGPATVQNFMDSIGVNNFKIVHNEEIMQSNWENQFDNTSTPIGAVDALILWQSGKTLSSSSQAYLEKIMLATTTGKNRMVAQLPKKTPVAHKTGTSGRNTDGTLAAVNDIGIITLPDGRKIALAFFVGNSKENDAYCEKIIADLTLLVYNHYVKK